MDSILFFFLTNLLFTQISSSQICSNSFCPRTGPIIRFPFRLQNHQPTTCGYPGFDLSCHAFNQTLIDLPNSGEFTVQAIDYAAQNIYLNDPNNCLPKRLLRLNLTGSSFSGHFYQEFTLFNCTFDYMKYGFNPIACLSEENYTVFASSSETAIRFLASKCSLMATVAVPVQREFFEPVLSSDLSDDIQLAWGSPRCRRCESRGGRCGFRNVNSTVIKCQNVGHRLSNTARYAIIAGACLPLLLCLLGMLCFLRRCMNNGRGRRHHHHPIMEFSMVVAPHPSATTTTTLTGLDDPTIESYPKTILGESCRLPKPDDNMCSICLSEYMPKENLRSIPECQHCFHAGCVDEWLRINSSCPVCRNSPNSQTC